MCVVQILIPGIFTPPPPAATEHVHIVKEWSVLPLTMLMFAANFCFWIGLFHAIESPQSMLDARVFFQTVVAYNMIMLICFFTGNVDRHWRTPKRALLFFSCLWVIPGLYRLFGWITRQDGYFIMLSIDSIKALKPGGWAILIVALVSICSVVFLHMYWACRHPRKEFRMQVGNDVIMKEWMHPQN